MKQLKKRLTIPEKFTNDLEECIKKNPPPHDFKISHAQLFIHYIITAPAKRNNYLTNEGYTLLNHDLLKKKGISKPTVIKAYLLENNFIYCDNIYFKNYLVDNKSKSKSLGYKLDVKYDFDISSIWSEDKNINRAFIKKRNQNKIHNSGNHAHLIKFLNKASIDFSGIKQEIMRRLVFDNSQADLGQIKKPKKSKKKNYSVNDFKEHAAIKYALATHKLHCLKHDLYYDHVDPKGGRLHTPYTNMPKYFRNYITYNGQKLISLDIKNSQPYFFLALLKNLCSERKSLPYIYNNPINLHNINHNNPNLTILPYMTQKINEVIQNKDVMLFFDLVRTGKFYEYLEEAIKTSDNPIIRDFLGPDSSRKALKAIIFVAMFSDNRFINSPTRNGYQGSELKDLFRDLFPSVYDIFKTIKKVIKKILP
ncbi:MAG: hypothetical protein IPO04_11195 [Cytophagaceae bacterium]|nr:hypothetical protein [Cytophagaceae bacterium]